MEERAETIGLAGPMTNYASPPQLVENVPYRDLEGCTRLRGSGATSIGGSGSPCGSCPGFCLLMKRAVYEAIGGLDERFGLGFFDDDDLAERARRAGFELAVAHDLFVHHFGSRTFQGNGIDAEGCSTRTADKFAAKWGRSVDRSARQPAALGGRRKWSADDADARRWRTRKPKRFRRRTAVATSRQGCPDRSICVHLRHLRTRNPGVSVASR